MVAFSFKKQHAGTVATGTKTQTIRQGKKRAKVGDKLQLYTGQRTSACRKLGDAICVAVHTVRFNRDFFALDAHALDYDERDDMARADGFKNWDEFVAFFDATFWLEHDAASEDFVGYLYKWRLDNVS